MEYSMLKDTDADEERIWLIHNNEHRSHQWQNLTITTVRLHFSYHHSFILLHMMASLSPIFQ